MSEETLCLLKPQLPLLPSCSLHADAINLWPANAD
jgi:hypothetical protein